MVTVPLSRDGRLNGIDIMADYGGAGLSLFHANYKSKIQRRKAKLNFTHRPLVKYSRAFSLDRKS